MAWCLVKHSDFTFTLPFMKNDNTSPNVRLYYVGILGMLFEISNFLLIRVDVQSKIT